MPAAYSFGYTEKETERTAAGVYDIVQLRATDEGLYIYYERVKFPLTFYKDIAGAEELETVMIPYGEKLSNYPEYRSKQARITVEKTGYTYPVDPEREDLWYQDAFAEQPKTDGDYGHKEGKRGSSSCKIANLAEMTMPAEAKSLYPVLIKHRVLVVVDLGAYDTEANLNLEGCQGDYWAESGISYASGAFNAHMSEYQYRTFMTNSGEAIRMDGDANKVPKGTSKKGTGMDHATRDGYKLAGW